MVIGSGLFDFAGTAQRAWEYTSQEANIEPDVEFMWSVDIDQSYDL